MDCNYRKRAQRSPQADFGGTKSAGDYLAEDGAQERLHCPFLKSASRTTGKAIAPKSQLS
jgi:hypothetical protein